MLERRLRLFGVLASWLGNVPSVKEIIDVPIRRNRSLRITSISLLVPLPRALKAYKVLTTSWMNFLASEDSIVVLFWFDRTDHC